MVRMAYGLFGLLPLPFASALGGWLGSLLGPRLARTATARKNLNRVMPDLTSTEVDTILKGMWNNIGRIFAEFPHMARMSPDTARELTVFEGIEHLQAASGSGCLLFTAHNGNWEYAAIAFCNSGYPLHIIFRQGNNPGLRKLIGGLRAPYIAGAIPKGKDGARKIVEILKAGGRVGMLIDQKMNDGINVPFFGINAMTAPAIARLALKYGYPIIPVRSIRTNGIRHKVTIYPPLQLPRTGDTHHDVYEIMLRINAIIEGWIREFPEQWYWLHNRWPDIKTSNDKQEE